METCSWCIFIVYLCQKKKILEVDRKLHITQKKKLYACTQIKSFLKYDCQK